MSVCTSMQVQFCPASLIDVCTARGTGPRKSSLMSLRFSDLFVIQRNLRDKRRFCKSAPPAVREAACQSLRTCNPSQTGALQTTTLGILPLFVQSNSRVLSNAGDSDGQNSNFMQAGDSDGRGDGQKPCFQSASNCASRIIQSELLILCQTHFCSSVLGLSDLYPRTAETKIRQDRSLSCFFLAGPIVELIADLSIIHATN